MNKRPEPTYVFDEAVATRMRALAYQFVATLDELLAHTRVEPLDTIDIGVAEAAFWEAHFELRQRLESAEIDVAIATDDKGIF